MCFALLQNCLLTKKMPLNNICLIYSDLAQVQWRYIGQQITSNNLGNTHTHWSSLLWININVMKLRIHCVSIFMYMYNGGIVMVKASLSLCLCINQSFYTHNICMSLSQQGMSYLFFFLNSWIWFCFYYSLFIELYWRYTF